MDWIGCFYSRILDKINSSDVVKTHHNFLKVSFWCPRQESNLHYEIRNLASYPLNDEGKLKFKKLKNQELEFVNILVSEDSIIVLEFWLVVLTLVRFLALSLLL
jgi:hypothetical protein